MSRIPELGPRGEGWVVLQSVLIIGIGLAAWQASIDDVTQTALGLLARQVGALLLIASLVLIAVSAWLLRRARALSVLPQPMATGSLVEAGPYRLVRHPIYSGLILVGVAVALIRVSLVVAVLTAALAIVLDLKRRREEAWLSVRYPGYEAYRARTRALIPFLY